MSNLNNPYYDCYENNDLKGIFELLQKKHTETDNDYLQFLLWLLEKDFLDKYHKSILYLLLEFAGNQHIVKKEYLNYIKSLLNKKTRRREYESKEH